jgi:Cu2+-exporting ATPase
VFSGASLGAVVEAIRIARQARRRALENFGFAAAYNLVAAPAAMLGFVNPFLAALAMSGSSLVVTLNALRLRTSR